MNTKVTTASKFSQNLSDAPSEMTVVTKDELKRFAGMTLGEILGHVAGLTPTSAYLTDRNMVASLGDQTRIDGGHILILINGRPTREILEGGIISDILESFPVNILERIEVIKGPGSVLYGSNAFSGVINLITKKDSTESLHLRAAGGPYGSNAESAEVYFNRAGVNVVGGGQYHGASPWHTQYATPVWPDLNFGVLDAEIRNSSEGGFLGVDYKGIKFESSYTAMEAPGFAYGVPDVRWKRGFFDVGYSKKIAAKWETSIDFGYTRNTLDMPGYPYASRDSYESVLEWTNLFTLSPKDTFTVGTVFNHQHGRELYDGLTPPLVVSDASQNGGAFYGQYERKLTSRLKAIGGLQANKIGQLSLDVVPRGGVIWSPIDHYFVKALYGGAFRAPSINETLLNHPELKGDPNLLPEKVGTVNLQFGYQGNRVQWSAGYFYSKQEHPIIVDFSTSTGRYINSPFPLYFNGFEVEAKRYLRREWFLTGSLLYQSNHDSTGETHISAVPNLGAKVGISYQNDKGAGISVFDGYEGHIVGYTGSPTPLPNAWHSVDAHLRFDFSKRWFKDSSFGFAAFAHGNNLANYREWLPDMSGPVPPMTVPFSRGRSIFFGLEFWQKAE